MISETYTPLPPQGGIFDLLVLNKKRVAHLICLLVMLASEASQAEPNPASILNQLLSHKNAERFSVLEKAKNQLDSIKIPDIEHALVFLEKKNVSTLIFALMQTRNDAVYKMGLPARTALENSKGSFPNIAYYYARVRPRKGLPELYRLYGKHDDQKLFICKAIGETGIPEALEFLVTEAKMQKKSGKSIIPQIAGLQCSGKIISNAEISWFLDQHLSREEIISLSGLRTDFSQKDMIWLCNHGKIKSAYVTQYVFRSPGSYFEVFRFIVDKYLKNGDYDKVLQLIMSDAIIRTEDQQVRQYRESVLATVRKKLADHKKNPR